MTKPEIDATLKEVEMEMRRVFLATGKQKYKKEDVRGLIHKMADRICDVRREL
jgi:NADPH-dependent glutamate synthase beta subunit-like oxidoreductase